MSETHYNKLVRDNIPTIIEEQGKKPITGKIRNDKEYLEYLGKKLVEESKEYSKSKQLEELIDLMEIIYSILNLEEIAFSEFEKKRLTKKKERGGFDKKILLLKVIE
ncbi:MAG: nucleoside triphosphate pyrophosphohydrolase [Asgard group archaeon]|nr:nucleoside triphosphate pyrophosphohydrolase [Asgard group archaeon]